jgi:hypothetical protein
MSDRPTPWAALGVADGADLETCAAAFHAKMAAAGGRLVGAHAEDRPSDVAAWAELVEAWRAVTAAAAR